MGNGSKNCTYSRFSLPLDAMKTANELAFSRDTDRVPKAYIDCLDFISDVFQRNTWTASVAKNAKLLDAVAPSGYKTT